MLIGRHVPALQHDVAVSLLTFPRSKEEQGRLAAVSDSEVDPAPANSQSRLLIAQLMAPLGLYAGDENDAKEFGRGSSQRRTNLGTTAKAAAEFIFVLISNLPLGRSRLGAHSPVRCCS